MKLMPRRKCYAEGCKRTDVRLEKERGDLGEIAKNWTLRQQ